MKNLTLRIASLAFVLKTSSVWAQVQDATVPSPTPSDASVATQGNDVVAMAETSVNSETGVIRQPVSVTDATVTANTTTDATVSETQSAPAQSRDDCQSDTPPAGHEVRMETRVVVSSPRERNRTTEPVVGDRVLVIYRFYHRDGDQVEFTPDPVRYAQTQNDLDYAAEQPERDRTIHRTNGQSYGEVTVAVQPFKTGEILIPRQLARLNAASDVTRLCTPEVRFRVRDPFGNTSHPTPRDLTPPVEVTENSLRWRWIAIGLDAAIVIAACSFIASAYYFSRPKPLPPPPPPRPPWEVALEELDIVAKSDWLARGLTKEYYDAISDIIRRYTGASKGFDALEMTTDEVLLRVRKSPLPGVVPAELEHLLRECDLVKFARYVPSHEEAENILTAAYAIVARSSPPTPSGSSGAVRNSTTELGAKKTIDSSRAKQEGDRK